MKREAAARAARWAALKLERAMRKARGKVQDLPTGFRFHDLRHYLASLLIASGADVKVVQARKPRDEQAARRAATGQTS
ncbi:tyrosine-type recombinase/integrase [Nonomuraea sp. NPDC052116]|uniref:tyrosine-type recombinase/integrase n=1 Tax=Nonomuraea sp. NPDC052116 TaxID=3155665 RepID=UPI00341ACD5B